jgi:phosphatidylglycerophosphatase A
LGALPRAKGTAGTLGGVGWIVLGRHLGIPLDPLLAGTAALGSLLLVLWGEWAERHFGCKDPPPVVLDEVVGLSVSCLFLAEGGFWPVVGGGFVLFRLFDIWKPFPLKRLQRLPAGWGIVADDWGAGLYTQCCLRGVCWVLGFSG